MNKMKYNLTVDNGILIITEECGNFSARKTFKVEDTTEKGIIVQYISKKSKVIDANGKVFDTTKKIMDLTSGQVKYSCDSYFEIFDVKVKSNHIICKYDDVFGNNCMCTYDVYDGELAPNIYETTDDEYQQYKTKGDITMVGKSCFICESTDENSIYQKIMNLDWIYDKNTPANGLPFLVYSNIIHDLIFDSNKINSNILCHTIKVKWGFKNPSSIVSTYLNK
jgi:hypothetical protein